MLVKITSKRQVTFPKQVMEKLRLKEGDTLSVSETSDGILIKPHRFDIEQLAPLRKVVDQTLPSPTLREIHYAALDPMLRD